MKKLIILTLAFFAMTLSGCQSNLGQRIAIEYGTHKFIAEDAAKAEAIVEHIQTIRERTAWTRRATVREMETLIRQEIRWDRLSTAESQLLSTLIGTVSSELQRRAREENLLPDEVQLRVRWVLAIIEETARTYIIEP